VDEPSRATGGGHLINSIARIIRDRDRDIGAPG
jgi:hypothetical protein